MTTLQRQIIDSVVQKSIEYAKSISLPVYTFAIYLDHESNAISVCIDTEENSQAFCKKSNKITGEYFRDAIKLKNLESAKNWQANVGRNLSLGDFVIVDYARHEFDKLQKNKALILNMINSLIDHQQEISPLAQNPDKLLFACSTQELEVGLVWSIYNEA